VPAILSYRKLLHLQPNDPISTSYWDSLSEEELQKHSKKLSELRKKEWESGPDSCNILCYTSQNADVFRDVKAFKSRM